MEYAVAERFPDRKPSPFQQERKTGRPHCGLPVLSPACTIFLYEMEPLTYKVSLRSKKYLDVNKIAGYFGGGGHIRAAGCTCKGTVHDVINNLAERIELEFKCTTE